MNDIKIWLGKNQDRCYFVVAVIMCLILYRDFIFGDKLMFYTDVNSETYDSYLQYYTFCVEQIRSFSWEFLSFQIDTGQSPYPFINILADPFNIISAVLTVPFYESIAYVHIIKILVLWFITYKYLIKVTSNKFASALGSYCIAFSGWMVLWGQHFYMASFLVFTPLCLTKIEDFLRRREKFKLFLVIAFLACINVHLLYQFAFYIVFYTLFRSIVLNFGIKDTINSALKVICIIVCALLLSSVVAYPSIISIGGSSRTGGTIVEIIATIKNMPLIRTPFEYFTIISRSFSTNLLGTSNYIGYGDYYEAPVLYSSILYLLLLPQIIAIQSKKQQKSIYIGVLILVFSLLTLTHFSFIFNGFSDFTMRWTFNIVLMNGYILSTIVTSFDKIKIRYVNIVVNMLSGILSSAFMILVLIRFGVIPSSGNVPNVAMGELGIILVITFTYMAIFNTSLNSVKKRSLIMIIVCIELLLISNTTVNMRNVINKEHIQSLISEYSEVDISLKYNCVEN